MAEKKANQDGPAKEPEAGELVTYRPGAGDSHEVKWRGVKFTANEPVRIYDQEHIDSARGNSHFSVGEGAKANSESSGPPTNAMGYRGHVLDWVKATDSITEPRLAIDAIARQWGADRGLREQCEVGRDDISYLGTLIEPKLRMLRQQAGMSENDVAGVWVQRGVLDLPWRS
jgi:hypothetical protein